MHANFHVTCFVSHIEQYIEGAMPLFIFICNNFFAVSTNTPIPGQWHEQLFILYHVSDLYVYRADRSMYHALCYGTIMYLQATMTFEVVSTNLTFRAPFW